MESTVILPAVLTLAGLFVISALFSISETAFLAINKIRLRHLAQRGSASAKIVQALLGRLDRLISAILVANNLVNVVISVIGTLLFVALLGPQDGPVVAAAVFTVLLLIFGEITPKLFAAAHADRAALLLARPLHWFLWLMGPVVWLFMGISRALLRLVGVHKITRSPLVTEEEMLVMIEMGREAGAIGERELKLLRRTFEFEDTLVKDVMRARGEIVAVEIGATVEQVLDAMVEERHSRLPVYRGDLDHVEGVLCAHDLLAVWRHGGLFVVPDLVQPLYTVKQGMPAAELLSEFQRRNVQIALVQDDRGHTAGLVTLEDVIEELVGEIESS